jgi:hypothetical protein
MIKTEQRVTSKLKTEERKQLARSTETAEKSARAGAKDLEGSTLQSDTEDMAQQGQRWVCLSGTGDQRHTGSPGVRCGRHGLRRH